MVDNWLEQHITQETGYALDDSLTSENSAAQAKKVGDEISDLKSATGQVNKAAVIHPSQVRWEAGGINGTTGENGSTGSRLIRTPGYYLIGDAAQLTFTGVTSSRTHQAYFYDADRTFIYPMSSAVPYVIPLGAVYVRFVYGFASGSSDTVAGYGGVNAVAADWNVESKSDLEMQISGAVKTALYENKNPAFSTACAYRTDGTTAELSTASGLATLSCVGLNVSEGQRFKIIAHGSSLCLPWATGDENGTILRRAASATVNETVAIASTEKTLFVNGITAENPSVYLLNSDGELLDVISRVDTIVNGQGGQESNGLNDIRLATMPETGPYLYIWEIGNIAAATGKTQDSTSYMRTNSFIPNSINTITPKNNSNVGLYAYGSNGYVGCYNFTTGEYVKTSSSETMTKNPIDMTALYAANPDYSFKLTWYKYQVSPVVATHYTETEFTTNVAEKIEDIDGGGGGDSGDDSTGLPLKGKNIVHLGDSIFGLKIAPEDIPTYLAELTGANCYNCAFGGTHAVTTTGIRQHFDLLPLAAAIVNSKTQSAETAYAAQIADVSDKGDAYIAHLNTLKAIDFTTVDIITMNFGTNDYTSNATIGTSGGLDTTFIGALESAIDQIQTAFPKIRFFLCTPLYRGLSSNNYANADTVQNSVGSTLLDYVNAVKTVGTSKYVDVIDNHYIGINSINLRTYLTDGTHPSELGKRLIASRLYNKLY